MECKNLKKAVKLFNACEDNEQLNEMLHFLIYNANITRDVDEFEITNQFLKLFLLKDFE